MIKKKICFVVSSMSTVNSFLLNHIAVLSNNFDIHLVANLNSKITIESSQIKIIKHIPISRKINVLSDIKAVIMLYIHLRRAGFSAVHSITPKAGFVGMLAAYLVGVPNRIHIFTGQVWFTRKGCTRILLKSIDRITARLATNILVDGHSQREFLIENRVIKREFSRVLGNGSISGVLISKFQPDLLIRQSIRKKWGIEESDIVFAFLGRLSKDKGVYDLIQAFVILRRKYAQVRLVLIGPDEGNVEKNVGFVDSVYFIGQTNEPEIILQISDVFCMPSYREGFGTSIIEASLLGLPVICSDTYGLMDTILDEQTGFRHKIGDVNSIYELMEKMVVTPELRLKVGLKGREFVVNNFDATLISNLWLNFYIQLLD
jgi:glycosyltransferase involved in cell wall biosynthesis